MFCSQYDWYTKKTSVVVDLVKRPGDGEEYVLVEWMTEWLPLSCSCVKLGCVCLWFPRWFHWHLQLPVVSSVLVSGQSEDHHRVSSAQPQGTVRPWETASKTSRLFCLRNLHSVSNFLSKVMKVVLLSAIGAVDGGYHQRECDLAHFK